MLLFLFSSIFFNTIADPNVEFNEFLDHSYTNVRSLFAIEHVGRKARGRSRISTIR